MTKQEFLEKLNTLLSDIPKTERDSAIQYYEEYFEEAGIGEYDIIPEDMETPEAIAKDIRTGLENEGQSWERYFEKGEHITDNKQQMDSSKIVLLIILAVFTSPLWASVLLSIAGVGIGMVCTVFGIEVAIVVLMASLLLSGIVVIIVGAIKLFVAPIAGVTAMGVGLILFGIGLLLLMLVIWNFSVVIPAMFRGISWIFQRIFGRKERGVNEKVL